MSDPIYYDRFGVQLDAHAPRLEAYYVRVSDYDNAAAEIARLRERVAELERDLRDTMESALVVLEDHGKQQARADSAKAERNALRADAERYRWLRDMPTLGYGICIVVPAHEGVERLVPPSEVDAAIDAAREQP